VKIIADGVIDSCTAAMLWPFAGGAMPPPIWEMDVLDAAVAAADAAGLQIAIHAVGDAAIRCALDAFEAAAMQNGTSGRRHRIEHAELPDPADIPRFGTAGVTASMQPVHADPAIRVNWAAMLGDERRHRGYPWTAFDGLAPLALGTDAPTAPHEALHNLFVAATRRSALDPLLQAPEGEHGLDLETALRAMTIDAAWSCRDEDERGSLEPGKFADLVALDTDPFTDGPEALLEARVIRTVVGGRTVFDGD
jgi:predicted amidohydrolase YtcJ